jgi:hypothetical protein
MIGGWAADLIRTLLSRGERALEGSADLAAAGVELRLQLGR